jgi:aspartate/methionine/tyrosine aminotransferase
MSNQTATSTSSLIERHRLLDVTLRQCRESFLSDWNCSHPFAAEFLGPQLAGLATEFSTGDYIYLDERSAIAEAVQTFHKKREALDLCAPNVLAGAGSSSLLAAFAFWLVRQHIRRVFYIPPLYHSMHYFLNLLNIAAVPVSSRQAFEAAFDLSLPDARCLLMFCDPIWYAGKRVPAELIAEIAAWQNRTGSTVFVDGSFQYLQWEPQSRENTSSLNTELTFRLICPTKALAVHSFRFSYLLHPAKYHDDLAFLYESMMGSVAVANLVFGKRSVSVLSSDRGNRPLSEFLKNTFAELVDRGFLRTEIAPDCGYYVFAVPRISVSNQVAMDQEYFELTGYPDYVRINLMAARRIYLGSF